MLAGHVTYINTCKCRHLQESSGIRVTTEDRLQQQSELSLFRAICSLLHIEMRGKLHAEQPPAEGQTERIGNVGCVLEHQAILS